MWTRWVSFPFFYFWFLISVGEFSQMENDFESTWESSPIVLFLWKQFPRKSTCQNQTNSGWLVFTDYRTSDEISRESTYFRFLKIHQENSSNLTNFISSMLPLRWMILVFLNTENNPPEVRMHRKGNKLEVSTVL